MEKRGKQTDATRLKKNRERLDVLLETKTYNVIRFSKWKHKSISRENDFFFTNDDISN